MFFDRVRQLTRVQRWGAALAVTAVVLVLMFVAGRCSAPSVPPILIDVGVDAGPGGAAIEAQRQAETERIEAELQAVEQEHRDALESFDASQREKYEAVRRQGPDEVARWLEEFNRHLRDSP